MIENSRISPSQMEIIALTTAHVNAGKACPTVVIDGKRCSDIPGISQVINDISPGTSIPPRLKQLPEESNCGKYGTYQLSNDVIYIRDALPISRI